MSETPQVSPDLASKVLAAETRNVIKAVGDGGTLPTVHRRQMQAVALTPELAAQQRAAALLAKYCEGQDLSGLQWEEVRAAHPGFASQPPPPSSIPELAADVRDTKLTKADEQRYSALYRKGWRQIRRWIEKGEKAHDPCPLHDPHALMQWWPRHNTWRVPSEIEEAALASKFEPVAAATPPVALADPAPPMAPLVGAGKAIDLESFDPEEGDRLRELKQIQAAKFAQLKDALKGGQDCTLIESKYLKLCETVDKIETRVTERLKKRGLFILRAEVERDLAASAELLRQSRASMIRRVQELCPSLTAEHRAEVAAAIERARASEERIFCRLDSLTAHDLLRELAA